MTALFIQQDYIKIDCDICGDNVLFIFKEFDSSSEEVKKPFKVYCRECLNKK